jgi:hypothetical protein
MGQKVARIREINGILYTSISPPHWLDWFFVPKYILIKLPHQCYYRCDVQKDENIIVEYRVLRKPRRNQYENLNFKIKFAFKPAFDQCSTPR